MKPIHAKWKQYLEAERELHNEQEKVRKKVLRYLRKHEILGLLLCLSNNFDYVCETPTTKQQREYLWKHYRVIVKPVANP